MFRELGFFFLKKESSIFVRYISAVSKKFNKFKNVKMADWKQVFIGWCRYKHQHFLTAAKETEKIRKTVFFNGLADTRSA